MSSLVHCLMPYQRLTYTYFDVQTTDVCAGKTPTVHAPVPSHYRSISSPSHSRRVATALPLRRSLATTVSSVAPKRMSACDGGAGV